MCNALLEIVFQLKFQVQEALLLQSDHTTHLSVEILQLRIIPFEKDWIAIASFK